ncbi:hypothetical protein [Cupriavidus metallidurans]|uniref:hypothetical protein n=1 Tax=Cupriavidus metallidurans TaxID=119219 RepID=UPI000763684F|nr:hypothetical protein [Cupriavidus metallidurans]KWW37666.1 hypothetical protein AU374_01433 [Cupriavidus metallidurans]
MTINSAVRKAGPFLGDGVATVFPFSFKVFTKNDVKVTLTNASGAETVLALDSDYSVAVNADQTVSPGGAVTYPAALAVGYKLTLTGSLPNLQPTSIPNNGSFYPKAIEDAEDRAVILIQQLQEQVDRSVKIGVSDLPLTPLPGPQARANELMGFDATGNLTLYPITSSVGAGDRLPYALVAGVDFAAGATSLTLPKAPGAQGNLEVNFDAFPQDITQLGISGQTLTIPGGVPSGVTRVWGYIGTTMSTQIPSGNSVGDGQIQWANILSRECASVAELRSLSSARYQLAHTTSYYGDNLGGGGRYRIDPSDVASADNGGTVIVANDGARWKLIYDGSVNFLQFGARTNGVETGARLQAALNSGVRSLVATAMHDTATPLVPPTSLLDIIVQKGGGFRPAADNVTIFKSTISAYYVRFVGPVFEGNGKSGCVGMDMTNMRLFSGLISPTFRNIDTGFIGREGCFGLHIVNPTAEAVPFPIIFINNNSSTVVECPNFDNGTGVGGNGGGTGITVQATGSNLGVVIRGGYIQGYDHAVFDNGIGTTVRDMYIENCAVADIKSTSGRSCRYENLNHWGNVGPFGYQLDGTDGCVVWNPTMGSGARGALFDVDASNVNFSYFISTGTAGLNQPTGTVVGAQFGPRSRFTISPAPTVAGGTTPGVGVYTRQEGRISLQAGQVELELEIGCTSHSGVGAFVIKGVPAGLAPASYVPTRVGQVVMLSAAHAGKELYAQLNGTGSDITVLQVDPATGVPSPFPIPAGGFTIILRMSWNANA